MLSMISLYISQLHQRMKTLNTANIKLLNGMHEGLLILSKAETSDYSIMFCNKSAAKVFTGAISETTHSPQ
jgi:hypothetical protein